jgi:hypothetical protein
MVNCLHAAARQKATASRWRAMDSGRTALLVVAVLTTLCCIPTRAQAVTSYVWRLSLSTGSPSCYERAIILVNGEFRPSLEVVQGELVEV